MIVEKGVPNEEHLHDKQALDTGVTASTGVGKSAGKRQAGLPDDEASADEDDDDDIPRRRQSTSCQLSDIQLNNYWMKGLMGQVR